MPRLLLVFTAALAFSQDSIPPDELRMHSAPYTPPTQYALKTETRLVEVAAVVRDSRNHTVGGLTRDDFEIEEGGKKREITAFSMETTPPPKPAAETAAASPPAVPSSAPAAAGKPARYLALVFDDLSMGPTDLIPARKAAKKFIAEGISAGDLVSVFFITRGQILPFTNDAIQLNAALDSLHIATRNPFLPTCPNLTAYDAHLISNHADPTLLPIKVAEAMQCGFCQRRDPSCSQRVEALSNSIWEQVRSNSFNTIASIRGIVDYMARQPGKRVLLMASSGFLSATLEYEREDVVNRALRGDVTINSLDAKGLYTVGADASQPGMNVRSTIARQSQGSAAQWTSNDTMAILSASTGGLFFHDNNDLNLGFRELGLAPEYSYSMAFTPPNAPDNKYHNLKVRLKQKNHYSVQARPGYFAAIVAPAAAMAPKPERRIDQQLAGAETLQELPVTVSTSAGKLPSGEGALRVILHLDVAHLPFAIESGVRNQRLLFLAALYDQAGAFVTGKESEMEFHLKENSFRLLSTGMNASMTLQPPAGKYRLRTVIQDANQGKFTAVSQPAEILP